MNTYRVYVNFILCFLFISSRTIHIRTLQEQQKQTRLLFRNDVAECPRLSLRYKKATVRYLCSLKAG